MPEGKTRLPKPASVLVAVLAVFVLGGIFLMYVQSDFLVQLSSQLWACF